MAVCPPGVNAGELVHIIDPRTGQALQVAVPPGTLAGARYAVQLPSPSVDVVGTTVPALVQAVEPVVVGVPQLQGRARRETASGVLATEKKLAT